MAAAPGDLGDFFKNKTKKKIKASNLNTVATAAKPEEKKPKKTDKDEEAWEEEQVIASTITRIEVVGNLKREEDKKEEEESTAPAWGNIKTSSTFHGPGGVFKDKQHPSLAKSIQSSNINIDDGRDNTVNIKTSKNAFAALDDEDGEVQAQRPKVISAAKVHKAQGERETVALQREVDKYVPTKKEDDKKEKKHKKEDKKSKRQTSGEDAKDEDDAEEADEGDEEAEDAKAKGKKKKKDAKKEEEEEKVEVDEEKEEDLQIVADPEAANAKYEKRRKLPSKDLPYSEMKEKENQQQARNTGGKKKKFANFDDDDDKPKIQYLPSDSD